MDSDSLLSTTGKGNAKGAGYSRNAGASYAGQGGSQAENIQQDTYGSFNQIPDGKSLHISQMGSGNNQLGDKELRGGGVIVIIADSASLRGKIIANGVPSITSEVKQFFHAGSGGYIYIKCKSPSFCNILNEVQANGGYGSDDQKSNAGSGGRIVFTSVSIDSELYDAHGGCSNILTSSNYNGAAGTIYFTDNEKLVIKHTTKCLASQRTVVDPNKLKEVKIFEVLNQATLAFSNNRIKRNAMNVEIESLSIINSTLANPISKNGKDLGEMNIIVRDHLLIQNSTLANIAISLSIQTKYLNLSKTSIIKYHNILSLNVTHNFNISGQIIPNLQMTNKAIAFPMKEDELSHIVYIYAGNTTLNEDPTKMIQRDSPEFVFNETSKITGEFIMLFSDKNVTIKGTFENAKESQEGERHIIKLNDYYDYTLVSNLLNIIIHWVLSL